MLYRYIFLIVLGLFTGNTVLAQKQNGEDTANASTLRKQIAQFVKQQGKVKYISQGVISHDGKLVAWAADGPEGNSTHGIYFAPVKENLKITRVSASAGEEYYYDTEPEFSPDGKQLAFLSDKEDGQNQIYLANTTGSPAPAKKLSNFKGYVSHLKWSPDGKYISVLYVEEASREPSPMAAIGRKVGLIDSILNKDVQRIAMVEVATGASRQVSPAGLYVFEYDWSASSQNLAYTAAAPPGDDNWYIAQLYQQNLASPEAKWVYKPEWQIALPKWSPDGKHIAFIEGLMSDQGGTGGEIFTVNSEGKGTPKNLTPGRKCTPGWFKWMPDGNMLISEFVSGSVAISSLNTVTKATKQLWQADASIGATSTSLSLSVSDTKGGPVVAFVAHGWSALPEVWVGTFKKLKPFTKLNTEAKLPLPPAKNIVWHNEGYNVQGWLLFPVNYDPVKKYPLLVTVHGGPAWIATPTWMAPDFNTTVYPQMGYFVFFPNARGGYGQGETFTRANRRDWGFGDLRDIIAGMDAVAAKYPIDTSRVGLLGWSYGGSQAMFAGTQTNKFKAVVAGAGSADWLSYYGQNSIDKWMRSYFGASPYDDPAAYAKVSAMTYIKKTKTPALLLVGEHDGESPPPQSLQYWHALKELGVPTQLMIYADEGHSFYKPEDMIDVTERTLEWFNTHMPAR
ncbi:alpha/beta hydrolase family protein [Adhaeribacter pallidiroseus]|uniref:Putative dipeptidyl-aminopeptidase n=1 Tax=Adhaeribacter pallidiroseus TaxID=2072847 RepID=A0A369QBU0_9BACT|nr:S9 family peptidase [Adhaeribacter pallidiroseus]RDC61912.1 putative dipeptidyl-aminopeptidase [Adhaeribacter pallidiroseus]